MKPALAVLTFFAASGCSSGGASQQSAFPAGNWQSVASETYSTPLHPVVTRAEFYLKIEVANDGTFRGEWAGYFCVPSIGAYGVSTVSCRLDGKPERVSGRFGPGGQGSIDMGRLGRSDFSWTAAAGELAIDLPKDWQGAGADAKYHRARLTRDGKPKPATPPPGSEGPLLSANALYREFTQDAKAALQRYAGRTIVLEGRRGTFIELSGGGAAIHIADGFTVRALVLVFPNRAEVSGIKEGEQFRFRCTVESFDYLYVHLQNCSIVR